MQKKLKDIKYEKAVLCNILIKEDQKIIPKLEAKQLRNGRYLSKPLEDHGVSFQRRV